MKGFVLYLLLIPPIIGYSQTLVDSLRNQIDLTDNPERKVDLLNELAFNLYDYSMEAALQTANQALKQSRSINYKRGEGWALIHQGMYYLLSGNITQAISLYNQSRTIAEQVKDLDLLSYAILQKGKAFRDIGYLDSADVAYRQAEEYQLKSSHPNPYNLTRIYSALTKSLLIQNKTDEASIYAKRELENAAKVKGKEWLGYAWIDMGDVYRDQYDFTKAAECYATARNQYGMYSWVGTDLNASIGIMQMMQGDFENAFNSLAVVMRAYDQYQGKRELAIILIKMAEILEEKGLYDVAQEYVDRALKICRTSGYIYLTGDAEYELAWIYYRGNQVASAELSALNAIRSFTQVRNELRVASCYNVFGLIKMKEMQYDSSLFYHQKSLKIRRILGNKTAISSSLFNLGELYLELKDLKNAAKYFEDGIIIDRQIKDDYGLSMYLDRLGRIYSMQNKTKLAEEYLISSIKLSKKVNSLDVLSSAYNDYSTLLEKNGDYKKALEYRKLYELNYDSIYTKGTAQSLISYRTLYDLESKERQIEILNKDNLINENEIQRKNLIIYGSISISLILIGLAFILFDNSRKHKRHSRDLAEKNEEIQTQSEELQEANTALLKLNEEVNKQREEIKSQAEELMVSNEAIAKINEGLERMVEQRTADLRKAYQELDTFFYRSSHDFRRPLTTLMGLCEVGKLSVKDQNAIDIFDKVNVTAINLDKMLMKLQSISDVGSHQLVHKEVLLKQIIDNELDNKREIIQSKQMIVNQDVSLNGPFMSYPVLVKIVVENLIENAIDFSPPANPTLRISAYNRNGSVVIQFSDNGEGIKEEIQPQIFEMFFRGSVRSTGNGLGLYIARKAVEKASGIISFKNNDGGGTTFTVEIPNNKLM